MSLGAYDTASTLFVAASNATQIEKQRAEESGTVVCDGTADNVEIQAAIDALGVRGGTVKLSSGTFTIAAAVAIPANVPDANRAIWLDGSGQYATRISHGATINGIELGNRQTSDLDIFGATISNMHISGVGAGSESDIGLKCDGFTQCRFENLRIDGQDIGIQLRNLDRCSFRNVHVGNPRYVGWDMIQDGGAHGHGAWGTASFDNCEVALSENASIGVRWRAVSSTNPFSRIFWGPSMIYGTPAATTTIGMKFELGATAANFEGVIFESADTHIDIDSESHMNFIGCEFLYTGGSSVDCFNIGAYATITSIGCIYKNSTNVFNGSAGSPVVILHGGNKNDGSLTNIFAGSFGAKLGSDTAFGGSDNLALGTNASNRMGIVVAGILWTPRLWLEDAIAAPDTVAGVAQIYVDTADGDLKVKFGDGTVKLIVADT